MSSESVWSWYCTCAGRRRLVSTVGQVTGDEREWGLGDTFWHTTHRQQAVWTNSWVFESLLSLHIVFSSTGSWREFQIRANERYTSNGFLIITMTDMTHIPCQHKTKSKHMDSINFKLEVTPKWFVTAALNLSLIYLQANLAVALASCLVQCYSVMGPLCCSQTETDSVQLCEQHIH